jgi:hypothetical protein
MIFESESQLIQIGGEAFCSCGSLQSISIPKGLRSLEPETFVGCSSLGSLVFESRSDLQTIAHSVFCGCWQLKDISLPASLCEIDCRSFIDSSIESIRIDESNPFCFMSGDSLNASEGMTLFRYFGATEHVNNIR